MRRRYTNQRATTGCRTLFQILSFLTVASTMRGQNLFGNNLVVNGNAEAGPAGNLSSPAANIPGWTISTGSVNVLPYGLTGALQTNAQIPPDHGFQYFAAAKGDYPNPGTLTQTVDVSPAASSINGGNVEYAASVYLGSAGEDAEENSAQMAVTFRNAAGQTINTITLGPLVHADMGMALQQQIGLVPQGTTQMAVTLSLIGINGGFGVVDSVSLMLNMVGTAPGIVLGKNLLINGNAEEGFAAVEPASAAYIPGWSTLTYEPSLCPYGGTGWISLSDPGPADRGVNQFCGGEYTNFMAMMYQDIDVSQAAALIDAGSVSYDVSAWLGGVAASSSPTLTFDLYDWNGKRTASTGTLGPTSHAPSTLIETQASASLPAGTRRVRISVAFPASGSLADDIAFELAAPGGPPVITAGGILSAGAFGGFASIAPGSWIEIYGADLTAAAPTQWSGSQFINGIAPTQVGDVTVSVAGQPAYIDYISPGQVNALTPSNVPLGAQSITLANAQGVSLAYPIYIEQAQPGLLAPPNFTVNGTPYVTALFPDGTYVLPAGTIPSVASRPAMPGDTIILYGVGFGPVIPSTPAGEIVSQQNTLATNLQIKFGNAIATTSYSGLAPNYTGLYQFNVVVPNVAASNKVPLTFTLGGVSGTQTLYIAIAN